MLKQGKYQEALTLALSFYKGKAKAVVGLSGGTQRRKIIVGERVCDSQLSLLMYS